MISTAEREVLRVIWAGQPISSREIILALQIQFDWSESTIKTLLGRLVDKGVLATERQGRGFIYRAVLAEEDRYQAEVKLVFDGICQRKHMDLLKLLVEELPMTKEQVNDLQAMLQEKNLVDHVPCNCRPGQCACQPLGDCTCADSCCSSEQSCQCENCVCTPTAHCGCQSNGDCACADGCCASDQSCQCENCICKRSEHCGCQFEKTSACCG